MSCGRDLVETLKKIGYPRAAALDGEDFDWWFEAAGGASFLRWFCATVSERNVLSGEELEAFRALQRSGQPVLDGAALQQALQTRQAPPGKMATPEDADLEALRREVRTLRKLKSLRVERRNRRQLTASASRHQGLRLHAKEEAAAKKLRQSQGVLSAAAAEMKSQLQALTDGVAELGAFCRPPAAGPGTRPPVFLSQVSAGKYLGQEERCTAALTSYTRSHFFRGAQEVFESSHGDNFQLLDVRAPSAHDDPDAPEDRRLEVARLQLAYVCAQHQLIHLKARNSGLRSSLKWAEENLRGFAGKVLGRDHLDAKISSLNIQILKLKEQITHIKDKSLPAVVKKNAQLLNMPVVKGDFDLQLAKQDYYKARQEFVLNQLIKQKASFELLQLSYEIEMRKHWDIHRQLEKLVHELRQSNMMLRKQLEMLADTSASQQINPRNTIDTKDYSTHRLHQLLEGENKKKELFITHENLEEVAEKLKQDVSLAQDQLAVSAQEHSFFLSKLNNDVDMLCDVLYQGGNHALLSDQELTEQFHQVESQLNKLNHHLTDILADVKTKRNILASNKLHQMERELYVYFCKDEDYLKEIVENLENQSKITAADLKD